MYRQMVLIRRFEELALSLRHDGRIHGVVHPYSGQEAIAVGVCANLRISDRIVSNHRGHGHCIAKGADVNRMMAELFGRRDGYCKGKGGWMHIADFDVGMFGRQRDRRRRTADHGRRSRRGAARRQRRGCGWLLRRRCDRRGPVPRVAQHRLTPGSCRSIWVCENNQYAVDTPVESGLAARNVADLAPAMACRAISSTATTSWRCSLPPATRCGAPGLARVRPCSSARPGGATYTPSVKSLRLIVGRLELRLQWEARDPMPAFETYLATRGLLTADQMADIGLSIDQDLAEAVAFADASPYPAPEEALDDVFAA